MKNLSYGVILFVIFLIGCNPFRSKECVKNKSRDLNKKEVVVDVVKEKKEEITKPIIDSSLVQEKKVEPAVKKIEDEPLPLASKSDGKSDKESPPIIDEDFKLNTNKNNALISMLLDNIDKQKAKLKNDIDLFNEKYEKKRGEFAMLQLPLNKIKKLIDSVATQSIIYEILGYSQIAIGKFKLILNILDLENPFSRDVDIVYDFISHLVEVSLLTHKVLYENFNLNTLDLEQIVINNGEAGINSLCSCIDRFMQLREQFILKAQNAIDLAYNNNAHLRSIKVHKAYATYKDVVLEILKSEISSPNGALVIAFEDLKKVADEIYDYLKL